MISCIMVTANRRRFVPGAIADWQAQTFNPSERELVVVDDGDMRVRDLVTAAMLSSPDRGRIRYVSRPDSIPNPRSIGQLRNIACDLAVGEWIAHWDDDDRNGPGRLQAQFDLAMTGLGQHLRPTERFITVPPGGADLVGFHDMVFHDTMRHRAFLFEYCDGAELLGTSLFYKRSLWRTLQFNQGVLMGEDTDFVMRAHDANALILRGLSYRQLPDPAFPMTCHCDVCGVLEIDRTDRRAIQCPICGRMCPVGPGKPHGWEFYQAARHHTASTSRVMFAGEGWEPINVEEGTFGPAALEFLGGKL